METNPVNKQNYTLLEFSFWAQLLVLGKHYAKSHYKELFQR